VFSLLICFVTLIFLVALIQALKLSIFFSSFKIFSRLLISISKLIFKKTFFFSLSLLTFSTNDLSQLINDIDVFELTTLSNALIAIKLIKD